MKIWNSLKNLFLPIMLLGLLSGALTGAWITLYRFFAARIIALSAEGYGFLREKPYWIPAVLLLFLFCAFLLALLYRRWPNLRGGGIPSSIAALRGMQPIRWLCDLIGVFCLSLCTFFFGVPLGNEGPSVQMGTSIGSACVRILPKKHRAWERYAMTGGACAGFSAATGAPISGIMFAMEDAHRRISPMIIMASFFSVASSCTVSTFLAPRLGLDVHLFTVPYLLEFPLGHLWLPLCVGLVLGLFSVLFLKYYKCIHSLIKKRMKKIPVFYKIFAVFTLTLCFGMFSDAFISTGHHLIDELLHFGNFPFLLLLGILLIRSTLTLLANTSGMTGGLFLPIMALGAVISAMLSRGFALIGFTAVEDLILVLGITACISGMMKTPITAIVFAVEALGCTNHIIGVMIASAVSFLITEIFRQDSITEQVIEAKMKHLHEDSFPETMETDVQVQSGSFAVGKHIQEILWPDNLYVLSVRHQKELNIIMTEKEEHSLRPGDLLHVRFSTYDPEKTAAELQAIVGKDPTEEI